MRRSLLVLLAALVLTSGAGCTFLPGPVDTQPPAPLPPSEPANVRPVALFSISHPAPRTDEAVTFDGRTSRDADGVIVSYLWTVAPGVTSVQTSPAITHTYSAPGAYWVQLTVLDDQAGRDTIGRTITVTDPPDETCGGGSSGGCG